MPGQSLVTGGTIRQAGVTTHGIACHHVAPVMTTPVLPLTVTTVQGGTGVKTWPQLQYAFVTPSTLPLPTWPQKSMHLPRA
jgi:hypothetical protein